MSVCPFELPYQTGDAFSKVMLPGCKLLITLDSGTDSLDPTAISVMGELRPASIDWRPPRDAWTSSAIEICYGHEIHRSALHLAVMPSGDGESTAWSLWHLFKVLEQRNAILSEMIATCFNPQTSSFN